jgi:hypothetical protein
MGAAMKITFHPVQMKETLSLARAGDALTLNGQTFDFSPLAEGASLPADAVDSPWFVGPVERIDGAIRVELVLPIGAEASDAARFPRPITISTDGPVELPQ